jgi:hypothetical protein
MSMFNVVTSNLRCPTCGQDVSMRVQFKYGARFNLQYQIGDTLRWGMNDIGTPGRKRAAVPGYGEACPKCGTRGQFFEIWLESDVIQRVVPRSGRFPIDGDGTVLFAED